MVELRSFDWLRIGVVAVSDTYVAISKHTVSMADRTTSAVIGSIGAAGGVPFVVVSLDVTVIGQPPFVARTPRPYRGIMTRVSGVVRRHRIDGGHSPLSSSTDGRSVNGCSARDAMMPSRSRSSNMDSRRPV